MGCSGEAGSSLLRLPIYIEDFFPPNTYVPSSTSLIPHHWGNPNHVGLGQCVFAQFWARRQSSIPSQVLCAVLPKRGGPADSLPCFQPQNLQWWQVSLTVSKRVSLKFTLNVYCTSTTTELHIWEEYIFWYQSILDYTFFTATLVSF